VTSDGKVAFTLRKGTHSITTIKASLNRRGVARATFSHVTRKGTYSIVGSYLGNAALKGSSDKDAFSVSP
jgi:hypothetical protein